jgi:hypothetical protein
VAVRDVDREIGALIIDRLDELLAGLDEEANWLPTTCGGLGDGRPEPAVRGKKPPRARFSPPASARMPVEDAPAAHEQGKRRWIPPLLHHTPAGA